MFDSTSPAWSPDGKWIAFTSTRPTEQQPDPDRTRNSDLFLVEAREGAEARRLSTWGGGDSQPIFSPDGSQIAYVQGPAEKYDFYDPSQLAVVTVADGTVSTPTEELDRAVSNVRWSPDGTKVHFLFSDDRERFVGTVPAAGGEIERTAISGSLLGEPSLGRGILRGFEVSEKGMALLATFSTRPTEIYSLSADTGDNGQAAAKALTAHNQKLLDEVELIAARGFDATSQDGTRVGSMLTVPRGYESGKAYPTIAYIHGGPVAQDGYDFDATVQAFAAAGYLVVQPNYRGSSGRGTDFSRAIYAKWGSYEIEDIHAVMDALVEQGLADKDRLGIGGWSYGGINTNYSIATDTRFSAAVSGSGIANLLTGYGTDQYIWQYEGEIGKPWIKEDLERYLALSYPFLQCRPHRDAYAVHVRREGFQRTADQLRADVSGAQESGRAYRAGDLPRSVPRPLGAELHSRIASSA